MGHTAYARFESNAICTATCSSALSIKHAIICLIRRKWRWQRCQLRRHRGSNGAWLILIACRVGFNLTVQCGAVQLVVVASDSQLQLQQPHPKRSPSHANAIFLLQSCSCNRKCHKKVQNYRYTCPGHMSANRTDRIVSDRIWLHPNRSLDAFAIHDDNSINCENVLETNSYSQQTSMATATAIATKCKCSRRVCDRVAFH